MFDIQTNDVAYRWNRARNMSKQQTHIMNNGNVVQNSLLMFSKEDKCTQSIEITVYCLSVMLKQTK